jgi:hypothetical protein
LNHTAKIHKIFSKNKKLNTKCDKLLIQLQG